MSLLTFYIDKDPNELFRMKKEQLVMVVAIGSGLLATFLVFNFLSSANQVEGCFVIARVMSNVFRMIQARLPRVQRTA